MAITKSKAMTDNIFWQGSQVSREERQALLGQKPLTIWLTGLSAAGKSTLAFALERELMIVGRPCYVLDGDNVRHGINRDLGFSTRDRQENIRRIAEVAKLMNDSGLIVITAFISPFISDRTMAREIVGHDFFREIYISTPLEECELRDPKGLYVKARSGEVSHYTGVSSPYEPPESPDIEIDTSRVPIFAALSFMMKLVVSERVDERDRWDKNQSLSFHNRTV